MFELTSGLLILGSLFTHLIQWMQIESASFIKLFKRTDGRRRTDDDGWTTTDDDGRRTDDEDGRRRRRTTTTTGYDTQP